MDSHHLPNDRSVDAMLDYPWIIRTGKPAVEKISAVAHDGQWPTTARGSRLEHNRVPVVRTNSISATPRTCESITRCDYTSNDTHARLQDNRTSRTIAARRKTD